MIAIIKGCGSNIASLQFALNRIGAESKLTSNVETIQRASHIILPGVGSASNAMQTLQQSQLVDVIRNLKQPVLGICLGMQLLFEYSEEGNVDCLGIIPGQIKPLIPNKEHVVPHMGWNKLSVTKPSILTDSLRNTDYFYFVHSYAAPVTENTIVTTQYGESFSALVQKDNFLGAQFHPEKSGKAGSRFLQQFLRL